MVSKHNKAKLILLATVVAGALITYWGLAFNEGELIIESEHLPVTITGMYDDVVTCNQPSCSYAVKPRVYDLALAVEGYTTDRRAISVRRNRTTTATYEAIAVPTLTPAEPTAHYTQLLYATLEPNGRTDLWQRALISDQKVTSLESAGRVNIREADANPKAVVETADGVLIEVDLVEQTKRVVAVPEAWEEWKLLGQKWVVWREGGRYFWAPFSYKPEDKRALAITSLDHIIAADDDTAWILSQSELDIDLSPNLKTIVDLFEQEQNGGTVSPDTTPFRWYQLDLAKDQTKLLTELKWTGQDDLSWEDWYQKADVSKREIYLRVDGESWLAE